MTFPIGQLYKPDRVDRWDQCGLLAKRITCNQSLPPLYESHPELVGKSPLEIFQLIFDADIMGLFLMETEKYAQTQNRHNLNLTNRELRQFFGICLLTGIYKFPNQNMYGEQGSLTAGCPLVSTAMTKSRCKEIKRHLHLADNDKLGENKHDKIYKVRGFLNLLNIKLQQFGIFADNLSVDEEMVPYYDPHSLKMCMLNKPIRFGYKLWVLCSSNGYPFAFLVYMGKETGVVVDSLGSQVVNRLLECVRSCQPSCYFENYFTKMENRFLDQTLGHFHLLR